MPDPQPRPKKGDCERAIDKLWRHAKQQGVAVAAWEATYRAGAVAARGLDADAAANLIGENRHLLAVYQRAITDLRRASEEAAQASQHDAPTTANDDASPSPTSNEDSI